jgi:hypothetical protein
MNHHIYRDICDVVNMVAPLHVPIQYPNTANCHAPKTAGEQLITEYAVVYW